jgi:hypothetical protein
VRTWYLNILHDSPCLSAHGTTDRRRAFAAYNIEQELSNEVDSEGGTTGFIQSESKEDLLTPLLLTRCTQALPSEHAAPEYAMLSTQALQRIIELCAAAATHLVSAAVECEDAAQITVMTTEQKIQCLYQVFHDPSSLHLSRVHLNTLQLRSQMLEIRIKRKALLCMDLCPAWRDEPNSGKPKCIVTMTKKSQSYSEGMKDNFVVVSSVI